MDRALEHRCFSADPFSLQTF